jgi:alpha-tubulin suppressor-like RCC1 family protein
VYRYLKFVSAFFLFALLVPASLLAQPGGVFYAWGWNVHGALGDGTRTGPSFDSHAIPVAVESPPGVNFKALGGSVHRSIGVTTDGKVYVWGQMNEVYVRPTPIDFPPGVTVTAVSDGGTHFLALSSNGKIYAWGNNNLGQLGNGTFSNEWASTPALVHLPEGVMVTSVAAGLNHSLAVASNGRIYAWGSNDNGQLGNGTRQGEPWGIATPGLVHLPADVAATAAGGGAGHSIALASNGSVYAWGNNSYGQMGNETFPGPDAPESYPTPILVHLPPDAAITAIVGATWHNLALSSTGRVYAWGGNQIGQLGNGTFSSGNHTPSLVSLPQGVAVTAVNTGGQHNLAVAANGALYSWGLNNFGQLGQGTFYRDGPYANPNPALVNLPPGVRVTAIAGGIFHSLALVTPTPRAKSLLEFAGGLGVALPADLEGDADGKRDVADAVREARRYAGLDPNP